MELYRICWRYKNGNTGHGEYVFTHEEAIYSLERIKSPKSIFRLPFEEQERDGDYTYWIEKEDNEKKRSLQRCSFIKEELLDSMWG
jgi:hypothetical protein